MSDQLEHELVEVLLRVEAAADPGRPGDLVAGVDRRYLRRRRRHSALAGVATVLLVAAAATGPHWLSGPSRHPATPGPATSTPTSPSGGPALGPLHFPTRVADLPALASAFPGRLASLPDTLPGGATFEVAARIDRTHVLVLSEPTSAIAPSELLSYDLRDGSTVALTNVPHEPGRLPMSFAVSDTEIVWWTSDVSGTGVSLWAVGRSGGTPRRVGSVMLPPAQVAEYGLDLVDMVTVGEAVYWSGPLGGVYTMPLDGSDGAHAVPGMAGYQLVDFPWASLAVAGTMPTTLNDSRRGVAARLRNVLTGQEIVVHAPPDATELSCVPTVCLGTGSDGVWFATRPDGSAWQALPDDLHYVFMFGGRYVVGTDAGYTQLVIVDTVTWHAGRIFAAGGAPLGGLVMWYDSENRTVVFVS